MRRERVAPAVASSPAAFFRFRVLRMLSRICGVVLRSGNSGTNAGAVGYQTDDEGMEIRDAYFGITDVGNAGRCLSGGNFAGDNARRVGRYRLQSLWRVLACQPTLHHLSVVARRCVLYRRLADRPFEGRALSLARRSDR